MYQCEFCNYKTNIKNDYDIHLHTRNHNLNKHKCYEKMENMVKVVKKINKLKLKNERDEMFKLLKDTMNGDKLNINKQNDKDNIIKTMEVTINNQTILIDELKEQSQHLIRLLQLSIDKKPKTILVCGQGLNVDSTFGSITDTLHLEKQYESINN